MAASTSSSGPWLTCAPQVGAKHASCCAARPTVEASVPRPGMPGATEKLLLCDEHFLQRRGALRAAGAVVFGADGRLIMPRSWESD
ncbi:hypothetical protein KDK95_04835 [Actinospica sp. MGRD01-02]|uniref:Uncharacterized protein n=1 Tax=Actinospica acidithermotolerans TaxID=2828514 RepID=A0A941E886_9ACTN|nr:hypothetical protein [Actinospica acidithermotolerans]MBR7825622.1 hypothetical protein [Actinospica acidithermotolerans]